MAEGDRRRHRRRSRRRLVRSCHRGRRGSATIPDDYAQTVIVAPELIAPEGAGGFLNADLGSRYLPIHRPGAACTTPTLAGLIESLMEAKPAANPARRLTVGITPSPRDSSPTRAAFPSTRPRASTPPHTWTHEALRRLRRQRRLSARQRREVPPDDPPHAGNGPATTPTGGGMRRGMRQLTASYAGYGLDDPDTPEGIRRRWSWTYGTSVGCAPPTGSRVRGRHRRLIDHLDRNCRIFIAMSPFCVISNAGADGQADASPRGGPLSPPDRPGNNQFDSHQIHASEDQTNRYQLY